MNCKPGDIAVVIAGVVENVGRLVRVERAYGLVDYSHKGYDMLHCWVVTPLDRVVKNTFGDLVEVAYIPDIALRPLPKHALNDDYLSGCHMETDSLSATKKLVGKIESNLAVRQAISKALKEMN